MKGSAAQNLISKVVFCVCVFFVLVGRGLL